MAAAKTIDVDMNNAKKKTNTYNCKGASEINVTYDKNFVTEFGKNVTLSGTTLTIKADEKTYKFKNITDTAMLNILTSTEVSQYSDPLGNFLKTYVNWIPAKGTKVSGSKFDDVIDVSSYENAKGKGLTVNAAAGSDLISSTKYADTLTGGVGVNVIEYTSLAQLDGDKINLTKGENLTIDLSAIANASAEYRVSGKNLVVTVSNGVDDPKSFTINNFGTKDVTNNKTKKTADTSSVELMLSATNTVDLRTAYVNADNGTWHNDNIDRSGYEIKKKGVVVTDWTKKGLSLNGAAGNDIIVGTNYSDTIKGGDGNDAIMGGTGNDKLYGGNGDDIITGGVGTDTLYGEAGKNTFVFSKGDGADTVYSGTGEDTLLFSGINSGELTYAQGVGKNNKDLVIGYGDGDSVTVKNYYTVDKKGNITGINSKNTVKYIYTANGKVALTTAMEWAELYPGKNLIISSGEILGTQSGDVILGAETNDTFTGKKGDDVLYGKGGNDTYIFNSGDGADVIYAEGGEDTLKFNDVTEGALTFTQGTGDNVKDLIVGYGTNDSVTVKNYYDTANTVKYLETPNGKFDLATVIDYVTKHPGKNLIISSGEINGTAVGDILVGSANNDTLTGNKGDDVLYGKGGNDTYVFNSGDGADVIYAEGGEDTIKFNDVTEGALTFTQGTGDNVKDLIVGYGSNDSVTVKNYYDISNTVKYLETPNGKFDLATVIDYVTKHPGKNLIISSGEINGTAVGDILVGSANNDTLTGNKGDDVLYGKAGNDTYVFNSGDGADVIYAEGGEDTIKFNDVTEGALTFTQGTGGNAKDLIVGYGSNDSVTVKSYFDESNKVKYLETSNGKFLLEDVRTYVTKYPGRNLIISSGEITGTDANEILVGGAENDIITGNKGNDALIGNAGNDTYVFNSGDGVDVIEAVGGTDTIKFVGDLNDQDLLTFETAANNRDLIIKYGMDRTSNITVKDYYDGNGGVNPNCAIKYVQIRNTAPVDIATAIASEQPDTVVEGSGDNFDITSTTKYVFGSAGDDNIDLADSTQLKVLVNAGEGNNTVKGKNGVTYTVFTGSGDDTITTANGNDVIDAGDGANVIQAGNGKKTITVGNSTNAQTNEGSTITLAASYNEDSVITTGTGNDTITVNNTHSNMSITSAGGNNVIDYAKLVDGMGSGVSITTGDGADTITIGHDSGGSSENTINAGGGNNNITFEYHTYDNTIVTGSGNDNLIFDDDNSNRNDITIAGGTNVITFGNDCDENVINAGGSNTVTFGSDCDSNKITLTGSGDDSVTITHGYNNVITATGGGAKTISVGDDSNWSNGTKITTGSGDDTITVGLSQQSTGKGATINAGDGHNIIKTIGDNYGVSITTGNSTNTETNIGSEITLDADNRYTTISTGTGNDTIKFTGISALYANITSAGGNNKIEVRKDLVDYENTQYVSITTGDGNDTITMGYMSNNAINAGNGNNTITVGGQRNEVTTGSGKDTIVMGIDGNSNTDENTITIGAVDGEGNVTVQGGMENSVTVHGGANTITINNTLQEDGKKNVITVKDNTSNCNYITVLGGHTEINARGTANITTGDGNDVINLTNTSGYNSIVYAGDGNNMVTSEQSSSEIHTGKDADIITIADGGTIYSGAGVDIINIGEGNHSDYVHTGAGDDMIYVDENKTGSLDVYFEDTLGTGGHDTISGLSPVAVPSGNHYLKIRGDISAEYVGEKSGKDLVIHAYKNGVDMGDTITVKNAYKDNGDLVDTLKDSSVYVNASVLRIDSMPNNMIRDGVGTNGNDWLVGTEGNDNITTGNGQDWIKTMGGNDTVTLTGTDYKNIYFTKGDGETPNKVTLKGFDGSTRLRIFTDDNANFSFSKIDTNLIITNSTGDQLIIENGFDEYGELTNPSYCYLYNSETLEYHGYLSTMLWDASVDCYPNENGDLIPSNYGISTSICHLDSETANTITVYPGSDCRILGEAGSPLHKIVIPVSGESSRINAMEISREGDDFIIYDPENPARARIVDFYKGQNSVDTINFGGVDDYRVSQTPWMNAIDVSEATSWQNVTGDWTANKITGSVYSDHIEGKGGDDVIYDQTGDYDHFQFKKGDGDDTIYAGRYADKTRWGTQDFGDQLLFIQDDVSFNDIELELSGNDLIVKYNHVNEVAQDSVTIKNYIIDGQIDSSIDYIQTGNEGGWSPRRKITDLWNARYGNITVNNDSPETVTGTPFAETFNIVSETTGKTVNAAGGDDTITVNGLGNTINGGLGENTINFAKNNSQNTVVSGGGHDTVVMLGESDSTNLKATVSGNDLILGYQNSDASTLTLTDFMNGGHSASTLKMGDQTYDLSAIKSAGNIIFGADGQEDAFNGTAGDDIMFVGFNAIENPQNVNGNGGNDTIVVSDDGKNKTINIGSGDDTIYTQADAVNHPANTITITSYGRPNGGNDVIYWRGAYTVLEMYHTHTKNDVIFTRIANDLVMHYNENDSVTIREYYSGNNQLAGIGDKISISFKTVGDPEPLTLAQTLEYRGLYNYITDGVGTDASDYMVGTSGADTINADAGNDIIKPGDGADNINLGSGNDILYAGAGGKNITAVSGNNIIKLGSGNNTIYAGTGNDTIYSGSGTNTVEFLAADSSYDDYYYGGGTDTLVFNGDALSDLTVDRTNSSNVVLTRGNEAQVQIKNYKTPEHTLSIKDKNTDVTLIDNLNTIIGSSTATAVQTLTTGDGNDTIYAGLGSDTIIPGAGTNTITLAKAVTGNNDTYVNGNGTDTFVLTGVADFSTLALQRIDDDLLVAYTGDKANNTLTISNFYADESIKNSISFRAGENLSTLVDLISSKGVDETIYGTDDPDVLNYGTSERAVTIKGLGGGDAITGSALADSLYGQNGADTISGGAGNDYINGGAAADEMYGGAGSDTYEIDSTDWADGQDLISDSAGEADVLKINTTADKVNMFFDITLTKTVEEPSVPIVTNGLAEYTTGNDLFISKSAYELENAKTAAGVKIENYFSTGKIETVQIPDPDSEGDWINAFDSSVLSKMGQIIANWLYTNGFDSTADAITNGTDAQKTALYNLYHPVITTQAAWSTGYPSTDAVMIGMGGNYQSLSTYRGNDIIATADITTGRNEVKTDELLGAAGNDIIYGSAGELEVRSRAGDDIIYTGNSGSKYIYAGVGNDTIYTPTDASSNYMYITEDAVFTDGGHDTIYWQGGTGNNYVWMTTHSPSDISLAKATGSDDLKLMYGDDNSVTLKDYYKTGNEDMGTYVKLNSSSGEKTMASLVTEKGVMNYIESNSGLIDGAATDDYIVAGSSVGGINSRAGSDIIVVDGYTSIYTNVNNDSAGKDTTPDTVDTVLLRSGNSHTVYAQSETNNIISRGTSTDHYYAYIDQATTINDEGGTDSFTLTDTYGTSDGIYKAGTVYNTNLFFEVNPGFDKNNDTFDLHIGTLLDMENAAQRNDHSGITITGNKVETIYTSDGYSITSANLYELAEVVAGWMTDQGFTSYEQMISGPSGSDNAKDYVAYINTKAENLDYWSAPSP